MEVGAASLSVDPVAYDNVFDFMGLSTMMFIFGFGLFLPLPTLMQPRSED